MTLFFLLYLAYIIVLVVAMWKIYEKAGHPGWESIIPFYNLYILLKIVGKPTWWLILFFIPFANVVFLVWTYNMLSKSFGKTESTTILMLVFGIGILQLGFGDAQYQGPYGDPAAFQAYGNKSSFDFEKPVL